MSFYHLRVKQLKTKIMKTLILFAVLTAMSICLSAQNGAIHGKILDEFGDPVYSANISIIDGPSTTGATSDFDGQFKIKPLNTGTYSLEISFIGYKSVQITGIQVSSNKITFIEDVKLSIDAVFLDGDFTVIGWTEPIVDPEAPSRITIKSDIILKTPVAKNPAVLARTYQSDIQIVNNQMVVRGSRPGSSTVYIDGMRVADEMTSLPSLGIGSMEIYTGGIPARFGDVTGGVIIMTTKSYFDILNERNAMESRR